MTGTDARRERLVAELQRSPKARQVVPSFLAFLCDRALSSPGASDREVIKRAKRSLHQVGGAYLAPTMRYDRWLADLSGVPPGSERLDRLRDILRSHASMAERLRQLDDYYAALLDGIGPIDVLLDLACGLNPLAQHAMPIQPRRYAACDIYLDLLDFVSAAGELTGQPIETFPHDLTDGPPDRNADVVLLLKTLPCLEQLDAGLGRYLLERLQAPIVLVTFPVRSLGGRRKGMAGFYRERFAELVDSLRYAATELDLPGELGFRLSRPEGAQSRSDGGARH